MVGDYTGATASKTPELFDGNSWTTLDPGLQQITDAKAVEYKGKIIVTGEDYYGNPGLPLMYSYVFDIATRTWSTGFEMLPRRRIHNAFLVPKSYCQRNGQNSTKLAFDANEIV